MKFDLGLAGFVLSLVVAGSGWFFRWNDKQRFERQQSTQQAVAAAEKALNEERDFNHLRRNQEQISQGVATGFDHIEEQIDSLRELMLKIEAYLIRNRATNHDE
ncbi:hypothetical protein [Nostoc sp.]|uniref:hypothetical protein n=1 Tax=Nostoc sp. TaxID=1180 RepID=UPI002FFA4D92